MRRLFTIVAAFVLAFSTTATARDLTTSARCPNGSSCDLVVDNDFQLENRRTGDVSLSFHDYADTADDDMQHASITSNCGTATTGAEECDLNISITTGGANVEVVAIDPAAGIEIGDATNTGFTVTTDGSSLNVEGTTANTLTFTAATTGTAIFQGADASAPAATTFDTTGAGAIIIGSGDVTNVSIDSDVGLTFVENGDAIFNSADSTFEFNIDEDSTVVISSGDTTDANTPLTVTSAGTGALLLDGGGASAITVGSVDVTSITLITDGGTVVVDGSIASVVTPINSLASGALTVNAVNLATAAATYDMPDNCDSATGAWVTIVVQDVNEVVIIHPFAGDTLHPATIVIAQDEVADSSGDASTGDGDFITFVCLATDNWFSTAIGGAWVDGGAS